jgi:hypothetical protein
MELLFLELNKDNRDEVSMKTILELSLGDGFSIQM